MVERMGPSREPVWSGRRCWTLLGLSDVSHRIARSVWARNMVLDTSWRFTLDRRRADLEFSDRLAGLACRSRIGISFPQFRTAFRRGLSCLFFGFGHGLSMHWETASYESDGSSLRAHHFGNDHRRIAAGRSLAEPPFHAALSECHGFGPREAMTGADLYLQGYSWRRFVAVVSLLVAASVVILGRVLWLQMGGPTRWSQRAREQQTVNLLEPPQRGRILDRRGRVFVDRVPRFLLRLKSQGFPEPGLRAGLKKLLGEERSKKLLEGQSVPLENAALAAGSELVTRSSALELQEISTRAYPYDQLACHLLGYVREEQLEGSDTERVKTKGVDGLEAFYDSQLRGVEGLRTMLVSATGVPLGLIKELEAQDGKDLITCLDLDIQKSAESKIDSVLLSLKDRPKRRADAPAVAILMDVSTGEILAMASRPEFSPRLFLTGDKKVDQLLNDPVSPLVNRAIAGLYPPASTFKLVTSAAVLRKHPAWAKESFYCSGSRTIGQTVFHCFNTSGHGSLTFEEAIAVSCDTVFYDLATRMPIEELLATAQDLGFGGKTGIDLPGENPGLLPDPAYVRKYRDRPWYAGDSANLGIGQGFLLVTPIQLLTATARLLTGSDVTPHIARNKPRVSRTASAKDTVLTPLWRGARGAVMYGTAANIYVPDLEIAGKTGTAEAPITEDNPLGLNHTWFVGWAPASKPEVVGLAFFEGSGGYGGEVAAPVVEEMFKAWKKTQSKKDSGVSSR